MTFNVVTSSFRVVRKQHSALGEALRVGVFAGFAAGMFALIGAYILMDKRFVIEDIISLSQIVYAAIAVTAGYKAAQVTSTLDRTSSQGLVFGTGAGLTAAFCVVLVMLMATFTNMREVLVAASPMLVKALSFGWPRASWQSFSFILGMGSLLGFAGASLTRLATPTLRAGIHGVAAVFIGGLFRDVFVSVLQNLPDNGRFVRMLFGAIGIQPVAAVLLFIGVAALTLWKAARPSATGNGAWHSSKPGLALLLAGVALLPLITGDFIAQVAMLVALYMLMGMGLNIELGLAGLVDLGFVAFFAVGAYTVALLCSNGPLAVADLSFWLALPVAVVLAALSGLVFGLPVLRVRGDYLAMATLGLGEIVRVLVLSDALAPILGGSQGIIEINRPIIGSLVLKSPAELYYLALVLAAVVAFISYRLARSRIGRAWLAIREDEDVAQALGIDPVASKLVAYTIGAAFAGAAGAVFAVLVGSVFPHSFQLLVSINVLAILVIGGLGSLPGVLIGAIVLIGLPELLREFGEFRYLFYGLALIIMMHVRAEGLWPATAAHNRETSNV